MSRTDGVSDLTERRLRVAGDEPARCSRCKGEWFVVAPVDGDPAGVTLTRAGRITGYCGELACFECSTVFYPVRPAI